MPNESGCGLWCDAMLKIWEYIEEVVFYKFGGHNGCIHIRTWYTRIGLHKLVAFGGCVCMCTFANI